MLHIEIQGPIKKMTGDKFMDIYERASNAKREWLSCCSRRSLEFTQFAISNYLLMGRVNILS